MRERLGPAYLKYYFRFLVFFVEMVLHWHSKKEKESGEELRMFETRMCQAEEPAGANGLS